VDRGAGNADVELAAWLQCLRLFHGEMFYSDAELAMVMASLSAAPAEERRLFFEECLRCRRRERKEWGDAPVARAFVDESEWEMLRPKALVEQARANVCATLSYVAKRRRERAKLEEVSISALTAGDEETAALQEQRLLDIDVELAQYPGDLRGAFERCDLDGDGALSRSELANFLKAYGAQPTAGDMVLVVQRLKGGAVSGDAALSFAEFEQAFSPVDEAAMADVEAEAFGLGPWLCTNPGCVACGQPDFANQPEATICVYCNEQGRPDLVAMSILPNAGPPAGSWSCSVCTLHNAEGQAFCEACGTARGAVAGDDFE